MTPQDFSHQLTAAYRELAAGRPVLLADDHNRENEVDAIAAASTITVPTTAWIIRNTSGYLCAPLSHERADYLHLPFMVAEAASQDPKLTAYTITCDAASGVTTGISAADRTRTFHVLADPDSQPTDLHRPGHVVPLRAKDNGVLERDGHTEGTIDLCRLAGLPEVGVLAEMVNDDGTMMRYHQAQQLAQQQGLVLLTIADLIAWRQEHDMPSTPIPDTPHPTAPADIDRQVGSTPRVSRITSAQLPTQFGDFTAHAYRDIIHNIDHVVLISPGTNPDPTKAPLVRIHSECLTGEAFGSLRCDCGPQLHEAMRQVAREGGAIIYLRGHEGRGIGLSEKIKAYALQDAGRDTAQANVDLGWPVDRREYSAAAAILDDLGMTHIRLLTNNPDKMDLSAFGIHVDERQGLEVGFNSHNMTYLKTKRQLGHLFTHLPQEG